MAAFKQNEKTKQWFFIIDVGYDIISGKRRQKTISKDDKEKPFDTERDARKFALKIERDLERGKKFESVIFSDFITQFFEKVVSEKVEETTYDNQWVCVRDYIVPYIGHMKIDKITDHHIETLFERLMNDGVSRAYIVLIAAILSKTFRHGQKKRIIVDNPMKLVTTPTYKPKKQNVWAPDDVDKFLESCKTSKFHSCYVVAESTGMRRGELLGLRWTDINLNVGTITINKALKYTKRSKKHIKGAKTENSRRTIDIPQYAVEALKTHKAKQMDGVEIVFDNFGDHYLPGELSRCFSEDCKRSGLPYISLHGLRHAHATYLLSIGYSVAQVAERLGDTKETIMRTYAHVLPNSQKEIAAALDRRKSAVDKLSE